MEKILGRWPTAVDLFSGSGAATAALKESHFRVVAAVDNDNDACNTYRLNHPKVRLYQTDIQELDPQKIKDADLKGRQLDLLIVCAPCQPFSNQNRYRNEDSRSKLLLEGARFAKILKPKVIFIENVPGLASSQNANLLRDFQLKCGSDYTFSNPYMVDAADYGVPQRRKRCLLLATRSEKAPKLPLPITPANQRITVRDAIFSLSRLSSGESDPDDSLHFARRHRPIAVKRLQAIPKNGGSRIDLPVQLVLNCHNGTNAFPDVYGRMEWDDVAPTLTTGCTDITRGRYAHPEDDRAITIREASLLQTFPKNYKFAGSPKSIATQIGNAVPFALIKSLAKTLRSSIRNCK